MHLNCYSNSFGNREFNLSSMKKNMGGIDRIIRFIAAAIIGGLFYMNSIEGTLAYVLLAVASIFVITSFVSSCPLYSLIGLNTCKVKK